MQLKAVLTLLLLFAALRVVATGPDDPQVAPTLGAAALAILVAVVARPGVGHDPATPTEPTSTDTRSSTT